MYQSGASGHRRVEHWDMTKGGAPGGAPALRWL